MKAIHPRYVFFDVANTLLHKPGLFDNILRVLEDHGIHVSLALIRQRHKILSEMVKFPNKTSREFYEYFNRELLLALGLIPEQNLLDEIFSACTYMEWRAFDDTKCLKNMGLPIGIISNWDASLSEKIREYIPYRFDRIFTSSETGSQKPDKVIFDLAAKGLPYEREQIVYVGDSIKMDYMGSMQAGFTPILIDRDSVYPDFNGRRIENLFSLNDLLE